MQNPTPKNRIIDKAQSSLFLWPTILHRSILNTNFPNHISLWNGNYSRSQHTLLGLRIPNLKQMLFRIGQDSQKRQSITWVDTIGNERLPTDRSPRIRRQVLPTWQSKRAQRSLLIGFTTSHLGFQLQNRRRPTQLTQTVMNIGRDFVIWFQEWQIFL